MSTASALGIRTTGFGSGRGSDSSSGRLRAVGTLPPYPVTYGICGCVQVLNA